MTSTVALDATSTLTDRAVVAMADRALHAARTGGRPLLDLPDLAVARLGERGFFTNTAHVLREPSDWDRVLARVEEVVPDGLPVSLISPWSVPPLDPARWQFVGQPPFMVRAAGGAAPAAPAELTLTEVADRAALEVFERTLVDGYPDPAMQPYRWGGFGHERGLGGPTRFFVGFVAGRPVATAAGHVAAGLVDVDMVATMPDARGRGYGEALTWAATQPESGLPAVLIASDLGRPVYERMGFVAVGRWTFWHRPA
ncbi:MAG TPA: GNAT family N-acetyltransferase [Acidimicrobiia bacterium]|nr:GNAT family N-acetyltransferase [Acidimicrobiia bacterium]